jgi:apolipoprotein D and lipocalin family protein
MKPKFFATIFTLLALSPLAFGHAARTGMPEVKTVANVDLSRFVGTWYEISSIPQIFQHGCVGTNANYAARPDGQIDVLNKCLSGSLQGAERSIHGVAWVSDTSSNAKLRVQFFWPLSAPYWIIGLGENYEYAITATPDRNGLWILSRSRQMDEKLYETLVAQAAAQGFDVSRLRKTLQPAAF